MDAAKILELQEWLIAGALDGADEAGLLQGVCDRLVAAGMELWRGTAAIDSLHPTVEGHFYEWRRSKGKAGGQEYARSEVADDKWLLSPFHHLLQSGQRRLRRRRGDDYRQGEFPILDDLFAEGVTDYLAYVVPFTDVARAGDADALSSSWCSDRPEGFTDEQMAVLDRIVPTLALALRNRSIARSANNLVQVYLGRDAGTRVLHGQIERGKTESIRAVVWYSDLAGFTRIADTAPEDQIVPLLNDYADCQVRAIHRQRGQVLKFVGDGLLAIFRGGDDADACHRALDAASDAFKRLEEVNQARAGKTLPTTRFYLGLHLGTVLYGNIGSHDRLDFTVVGQAVNEASRIQALCKSLDRNVILSAAFAKAATRSDNRLLSLGRYGLRGVRQAQELFTLDDYAPL
ncbi:MAG: adenylate/guanylate cyclase domain-containing protein [Alphaproteobacteria bacterium]|nr:adenylate/guanylate cyclase domain-containing protein [Alphaproteobacteria bacterium]